MGFRKYSSEGPSKVKVADEERRARKDGKGEVAEPQHAERRDGEGDERDEKADRP